MTEKDRFRIGVIGCGKQAYKHVPALRKLGCQVTVADKVKNIAVNLARDLQVDYAASPQALLEDDRIAAVSICSPTPTHCPVIFETLGAGKHFFCEVLV